MVDPLEELNTPQGAGQTLRSVLDVVRKHKWLLLAVIVVVPTLAGFVVSTQPKLYQAKTTVIMELSVPQYLGPGFRDVVEVEPSWWSSRETLETQYRLLRSHSQARAVAQVLCKTPFGDKQAPALAYVMPQAKCQNEAEFDAAATVLESMISVEPVNDSRLLVLRATSGNPEFAALLANTAADVFVDRNLERRLSHSAGAASWLGSEFADLTEQLNAAEHRLLEFKRKHNIVSVSLEDDQNVLATKRKRLAEELNSATVKLIQVRAQRQQYEVMKAADPSSEFASILTTSDYVQKLKEHLADQTGRLTELRGKYVDKHPEIVGLESRIAETSGRLSREIEATRKGIEFEFQTLNRQVNELQAALDVNTKEALQIEAKTSEYNRLRRQLDRLVNLSEQVGGRESETSLASHLKTNNVRVVDPAVVPKAPVSPNVPQAVAVAMLAAVLLGIGLALLLDSLDNTVKTPLDVENRTGLTFLGLIPSIPSAMAIENKAKSKSGRSHAKGPTALPPEIFEDASDNRDLYIFRNPKSPVAECCRSIRTNLMFMSPEKPARSLLITSARPQEGKTTGTVSLAVTMAQTGLRVLIVDTDMRRPRLHKSFGVIAGGAGLSTSIVGDCDVMQAICDTPVPNLSLLPCGPCPPNPAELLHTERFKRIVAQLEERFDLVVFDSPPLDVVTDAAILARLTDATLLVAKAGRTTRDALNRSRRHLIGGGKVNLLGCILNDFDMTAQGPYGYYSYSQYSYYGEDAAVGAVKAQA